MKLSWMLALRFGQCYTISCTALTLSEFSEYTPDYIIIFLFPALLYMDMQDEHMRVLLILCKFSELHTAGSLVERLIVHIDMLVFAAYVVSLHIILYLSCGVAVPTEGWRH